MPWKEMDIMSLREEFCLLAIEQKICFGTLCQRYGISRPTGYKWKKAYQEKGFLGLQDHSRRPHSSPHQTSLEMEAAVVRLRQKHPSWGGRKIRKRLEVLQHSPVPAASTITGILRRQGLLDRELSPEHLPWQRFEKTAPNLLWQMDFKGRFAMESGECHPLTILDDHSRFSLGLFACANQQESTVKTHLITTFRRYGLPWQMLMDNGAPWGGKYFGYTALSIWLIRLGIWLYNGKPGHPQTQGKEERFHRTLKAEVLQGCFFRDLPQCQQALDHWRDLYNLERPHQALQDEVPASRYVPSPRPFPETVSGYEYSPQDQLRKVQDHGKFSFQGKVFRVSKALRHQTIALRPTAQDGLWKIFFCHQPMGYVNLQQPQEMEYDL